MEEAGAGVEHLEHVLHQLHEILHPRHYMLVQVGTALEEYRYNSMFVLPETALMYSLRPHIFLFLAILCLSIYCF